MRESTRKALLEDFGVFMTVRGIADDIEEVVAFEPRTVHRGACNTCAYTEEVIDVSYLTTAGEYETRELDISMSDFLSTVLDES